MFENVLGQPVIQLVSDELEQGKVPPALLFAGPESSGKLTAALETARILSCTESGSWTCACESCKRHKDLSSSDLLILGTRDTVLETKAAAHALCTAKTTAARYLFVRAVRKLTSRFDSRLWDTDESRFVKAAPILADIEESLADLIDRYGTIETISEEEAKKLEKLTEKSTDLCQKLQEDCMYDTLPVNQVRKASAWVRLMPVGKKKVLIIENADKMQESARNAFLKILEEPPEYTVFILTTARRAAVIPLFCPVCGLICSSNGILNINRQSSSGYSAITIFVRPYLHRSRSALFRTCRVFCLFPPNIFGKLLRSFGNIAYIGESSKKADLQCLFKSLRLIEQNIRQVMNHRLRLY